MPHKRKTRKKLTLLEEAEKKEEQPEKVIVNEENKPVEDSKPAAGRVEPAT